mmetsp:Transcript_22134/g.41258  ORF Transcript_22134/g.41258 Transcript_22134/m.41258 type:complete len:213 (+) Transcript_22134:350-988(+)
MGFMEHSRIVQSSASTLVALECPSATFVPVRAISEVPMAQAMALSPCYGCSTTLRDMSTRVVGSGREVSQLISSHGMQMSSTSLTSERIMGMKMPVPVTYFMHCGFQISSWNASRRMATGHSCALTNVPVCQTAMGMNSTNCTRSTKERGRGGRQSKPRPSGLPFLMPRSRQARHTCFSKITATESQIRKILAPSSARTYARRLWSTLLLMR